MTHVQLRTALASLPLAAALAFSLTPELADACGGTFCDGGGPNIMPVDQTGENILFWIDHSGSEPHTEAHIQIQYEGDAANFAWIIPVLQVPEVMVGNQALFDNLLSATVPTFTIQTVSQPCADSGPSVGLCAFKGDDSAFGADEVGEGSFTGGGDDVGEEGGGPQILDRGFAGAFEYVVLTGDTVQEIVDWLEVAGYAQDADAPPILQEYLDDDFVFVAVKLRGGAGVDEIHPLAIRYAGIEPCIPIKLTRIAAVDDMAIRAFFLGDNRVAPQNWPHVVIDPVRLDWVANPAVNYRETVSLALDEAGSRAFITEYAGTDAIISTSRVDSPAWDPSAFEAVEPINVVNLLANQGLALACDDFGTCQFPHPQVEALLDIYLPAPQELDRYEFWANLVEYEGLIDPVAWSGTGFAADFAERISTPGQHAIEMLESSDYLTRLFTLLSPHEMTDDPTFHETDSLPPVDNTTTATRTLACEGADWIDLEDGRRVALTDGGVYPVIEGLPTVERIERVPAMGPAQVETDNAAKIDELLEEWNHSQLEGPQAWNCSIATLRPEALLTMIALFGVAGFTRGRRRREQG